jgi:hypothetical protein
VSKNSIPFIQCIAPPSISIHRVFTEIAVRERHPLSELNNQIPNEETVEQFFLINRTFIYTLTYHVHFDYNKIYVILWKLSIYCCIKGRLICWRNVIRQRPNAYAVKGVMYRPRHFCTQDIETQGLSIGGNASILGIQKFS